MLFIDSAGSAHPTVPIADRGRSVRCVPPVIFSRRDAVGEDVHRSSFVIVGFSTSLLFLLLGIATLSPWDLISPNWDQLEAVGEISPGVLSA